VLSSLLSTLFSCFFPFLDNVKKNILPPPFAILVLANRSGMALTVVFIGRRLNLLVKSATVNQLISSAELADIVQA